jgi:hypothetical protein
MAEKRGSSERIVGPPSRVHARRSAAEMRSPDKPGTGAGDRVTDADDAAGAEADDADEDADKAAPDKDRVDDDDAEADAEAKEFAADLGVEAATNCSGIWRRDERDGLAEAEADADAGGVAEVDAAGGGCFAFLAADAFDLDAASVLSAGAAKATTGVVGCASAGVHEIALSVSLSSPAASESVSVELSASRDAEEDEDDDDDACAPAADCDMPSSASLACARPARRLGTLRLAAPVEAPAADTAASVASVASESFEAAVGDGSAPNDK